MWLDRPNHDRRYPDIAVPLELNPTFTVPQGENQATLSAGTVTYDITSFVNGHLGEIVTLQLINESPDGKYLAIKTKENTTGRPYLQLQ